MRGARAQAHMQQRMCVHMHVCVEVVQELDKQFAKQTRHLATQGNRREYATPPPFRLKGPVVSQAFDHRISFYSLLKKPSKAHKRLERANCPVHEA